MTTPAGVDGALPEVRPDSAAILEQWRSYFSDPMLSLATLRQEAEEGRLPDRGLRSLSWRVCTAQVCTVYVDKPDTRSPAVLFRLIASTDAFTLDAVFRIILDPVDLLIAPFAVPFGVLRATRAILAGTGRPLGARRRRRECCRSGGRLHRRRRHDPRITARQGRGQGEQPARPGRREPVEVLVRRPRTPKDHSAGRAADVSTTFSRAFCTFIRQSADALDAMSFTDSPTSTTSEPSLRRIA